MKINNKEITWWKILILLIFLMTLFILFNSLFIINEEWEIKTGTFNTGSFDNYNEIGNIENIVILKNICDNEAELYYSTFDTIWIRGNGYGIKGYCHLIYKEKVNKLRLRK